MPVFEYTALNSAGRTISGIVDADSIAHARQKIRTSGLYPTYIHEAGRAGDRSAGFGFSFPALFRRVRAKDLAVMTRQLSALVGAGIPLVTAIETLIPHTRAHQLKKQLARVKNALLEGKSLYTAMSALPDTFPDFYVHMVHSGENSGTLDVVLERLSDILEKREAIRTRIQTAMVYPAFMTVIGIAVLAFLTAVIVPGIARIFTDMNQTLPTPTRMLLWAGNFLQSWWWMILALLVIPAVALRYGYRFTPSRRYIDRGLLRMPIAGDIIRKTVSARFARTLGSLLQNGVTMLTALHISGSTIGNTAVAGAVEQALVQVETGKGLAVSLEATGIFPSLAIQMILVGEQTGELETMLIRTADLFDRETEAGMLRMIAVLEPVMILAMGLVVGFIVLAVCLPIFDMNQLIPVS
jgi:general secretion pathway protein F